MDPLAPLLGRTLVIVAHPDDEAVACAALMQRMREPHVLFCTDGGPLDPYFWKPYGSREAYSQLREKEARAALKEVGVSNVEFLKTRSGQPIIDQQLFQNLPEAVPAVSDVVARIRPDVLLTIAYEGGHPDHDSCSFITSVIAREQHLPSWEMPIEPLFKKVERKWQTFLAPAHPAITLHPTPGEVDRKRRALRAYASQGNFDSIAGVDETFRPMPQYDYARRPHQDELNYESWQWKMTGDEVAAAFKAFIDSH
ncbi:PIG-L deacetylase family protein [Occallatibacter savannae]|uniref:PIG-L deacetylase family protein n=1 Tax=Occallatibacter savannae TaxID=1002691 RepID=UPI000D6991C6|nr:PIG-L family deacetylase [Occallatibacter savannae]